MHKLQGIWRSHFWRKQIEYVIYSWYMVKKGVEANERVIRYHFSSKPALEVAKGAWSNIGNSTYLSPSGAFNTAQPLPSPCLLDFASSSVTRA